MAIDTNTLNEHVSADAARNIQAWLHEPKYAEYKDELEKLIFDEQWQILEDSFFKVIEFGTAGRRGTVGIGSNRINNVTIGESAQALCLYAKEFDASADQKGIVIACDTRVSSDELSKISAAVCAANGFKVYIFESFRSTPELSFAVRYLKAAAGIVISASHNPPEDNGFKVCWSDGGLLVAPHDEGVLAKAAEVEHILTVDFDQALSDNRIEYIGTTIDEAYTAAAVEEAEGEARALEIVYSPLHGAGQTNVLPVLRAAGFEGIHTVEAQMVPDGMFPTIPSGKPNPEEKAANDMAVQLLKDLQADIAITNDPDADRIGVMGREGEAVIYFSGNQSAVLATDYALRKKQQKGELTDKHFIAKTIVTTDMLQALADHYKIKLYGTMLVGFKYIGELLHKKESTDEIFVIGGEESYGLIKGTYVRDKDGAAGALTLAEYAAELKQEGSSLYTRLIELFATHGIYEEKLGNVYFRGADGFERMQAIMKTFRTDTPTTLGGYEVSAVQDFASLQRREIATDEIEAIDCASGNVLVFEFGDRRRRLTIRPSGTEPKLKLYLQWYEQADDKSHDAIVSQYEALESTLDALLEALEAQITSE